MDFVAVAQVDQIAPGAKKKIELEDRTLTIVNIAGNFYALDNKCPHMGGSLGDGTLEGPLITCPRHHTTFDVTSGKVVHPGKLALFKVKPGPATTYPVKVEGNAILVALSPN